MSTTKDSTTSLSQSRTQQENLSDLMTILEHQMKELWSQYMNCVEQNGSRQDAQDLRDEYFKIYNSYKNNRAWQKAIENV